MATKTKAAKPVAALKVETERQIDEVFTIAPPNFQIFKAEIVGTAPLMMSRFSEKMKEKLLAQHIQGSAKTGKRSAKPAKDVQELFQNARYISHEGWDGILCASIRNALIRTCSIVGFKMTAGKQSLFILPDGFDATEGVPLVRILSEPPVLDERMCRNANGQPDIRIRPRYDDWRMVVMIQFDADVFEMSDVMNLLSRAGVQNGLGEGRPFSKNSTGMGFGTFSILNEGDAQKESSQR